MNESQASDLTYGAPRTYFHLWMPYLFRRVECPGKKHVFLPLNRDYKPLGYLGRDHVDYEAMAASHGVSFTRDPLTFEGIWTANDLDRPESEGLFWLYNDHPRSRTDYFQRFEKLMIKGIKVVADVK